MVNEIKASEHKIYPELIVQTDGVDLAEGETNLFKIDNIDKKNQLIAPLGFAVEAVTLINVIIFRLFKNSRSNFNKNRIN